VDDVDIDDIDIDIDEEYALRFGGVGRLYQNQQQDDDNNGSPNVVDDDNDNNTTVVDTVLRRLFNSHVMVVGLGGVGSWAAEALARSGIGTLTLVDLDDVCISNTNRQLHTLQSTVGKMKIDVMAERLQQIHPHGHIRLIYDFVNADNIHDILLLSQQTSEQTTTSQQQTTMPMPTPPPITVVLDAIDGSSSKTALLWACIQHAIPIVTCGGSAGRTDPTQFVVADLTQVKGDPLLAACRKKLRQQTTTYKYGNGGGGAVNDDDDVVQKKNKRRPVPKPWNIAAVYSTEPQKKNVKGNAASSSSSLRRCDGALGTASFVTGTSGLIAAGKVVDMIAKNQLLIPKQPQPPQQSTQ
jgi:tRNA threonylcarbamoyladenosine dehydratase